MTALTAVLRDPTLRMITLALLLLGAHNAATYPYQSLIAIEVIGLSEPAFALVLVLASALAVTSSVLFGIFGDRFGNRRGIALGTALCSTIGITLMLLVPGPVALVITHGILLPIASSFYGQLFALARLARQDEGRARDGILATIRAAMSISFTLMLVFWTFAFATGIGVMAIYVSAGLASLAISALVYFGWPRDGATTWEDRPSGLNMTGALAEIARPHVLLRLLLLGAISSAGNLYMILASLVFDASPVRDTGDVALYVGLVAAWEVPFMLLLPWLALRMRRTVLLAVGTALYVSQLLLMPHLVDTAYVWVLTLLAGMGGTAIITLPISYYQDLILGRPGTAAAMLALQKLVGDMMAACAFVIGTWFGGYGLTGFIGTTIALTGAVGLIVADRRR
ncbi:MAG: MFS transporter [Pseudomonadota bacterium]